MAFDLDGYLNERKTMVEAALAAHLDRCEGAPPTLARGDELLAARRAASGCARSWRWPRARRSAGRPRRRSTPPAPSSSCTPTRSSTTICRRWTTTTSAAAGRRRTRSSARRWPSSPATRSCAEAFRVAAERRRGREERVADVVFELARASGAVGMVGGQVIDIEATGKRITVEELETLHRAKTGELLLVAVRAGARMGGADAGGDGAADRVRPRARPGVPDRRRRPRHHRRPVDARQGSRLAIARRARPRSSISSASTAPGRARARSWTRGCARWRRSGRKAPRRCARSAVTPSSATADVAIADVASSAGGARRVGRRRTAARPRSTSPGPAATACRAVPPALSTRCLTVARPRPMPVERSPRT